MAFEWYKPQWWMERGRGAGREGLDLIAWAYALQAVDAGDVLEFVRGWQLSESDLPDRALGMFPINAGDVEPFLESANALADPEAAAAALTARLIALDGCMNEAMLALNILDVWRHCHYRLVDGGHDARHCACLMTCSSMPPGIRALDEAVQTYYERHHELPWPECCGTADEPFRHSLQDLVRNCLPPDARA